MSSTDANRKVEAALNKTNDKLTTPLRTSSNNGEASGNAPEQKVKRNPSIAKTNKDQPQRSSSSTCNNADEQPGPSKPTHKLPASNPVQPQSSRQARPQQALTRVAEQQMNEDERVLKRKQIQQHLMLSLHAHTCSPSQDPQWRCPLINCRNMKSVLVHMENCTKGMDCLVTHCSTTRKILGHWKQCRRAECLVCQPFRHHDKKLRGIGQTWPVQPALRDENRSKLVKEKTVFANNAPFSSADPRMIKILHSARVVEKRLYKSSNSKEEYMKKMNRKIDSIRHELVLEEQNRRERRLQQELKQAIASLLNDKKGSIAPPPPGP